MSFSNRNYMPLFMIGDTTIYLTDTMISTWAVMLMLIIFAVVVRIKMKKFKKIPTGFQNMVELMVETMDNFSVSNMGESNRYYGGLFFAIFAFILVSNLSGLLGFRPPTADVATTGALAIIMFVVIHFTGITRQKGKYLKSFVEPNPIFLPINLISEVSNILSLAFRLMGNIMAGVIVMGVMYGMLPSLLKVGVPAVLHVYFDVFSGALQAFIFTVLSMTFISQKSISKG